MSAHMTQNITSVLSGGPECEVFSKGWAACEHPERPPDKNVMYHIVPDCHGCNVAKEAAAKRETLNP